MVSGTTLVLLCGLTAEAGCPSSDWSAAAEHTGFWGNKPRGSRPGGGLGEAALEPLALGISLARKARQGSSQEAAIPLASPRWLKGNSRELDRVGFPSGLGRLEGRGLARGGKLGPAVAADTTCGIATGVGRHSWPGVPRSIAAAGGEDDPGSACWSCSRRGRVSSGDPELGSSTRAVASEAERIMVSAVDGTRARRAAVVEELRRQVLVVSCRNGVDGCDREDKDGACPETSTTNSKEPPACLGSGTFTEGGALEKEGPPRLTGLSALACPLAGPTPVRGVTSSRCHLSPSQCGEASVSFPAAMWPETP